MPDTMELAASASPQAIALLNRGLQALQDALRLALRDRADSYALQQALDQAFSAYDAYISHVVAAHPMSCKDQCTACCHDNPQGVTGIEALRLQNQLQSRLSPYERTQIRTQAQSALAAGSENAALWRAQSVPCPLLKDQRCGIYAQRPIACRAFYAHSPASWCHPDHPQFSRRVNPHLDPPAVYLQILTAISQILQLSPTQSLHQHLARE